MHMVQLNDLLPQEQWEGNWTIFGDQHDGLPDDAEYVIFEYYCANKDCDCKTLVTAIEKLGKNGEPDPKPMAVIDYDWSTEEKACSPTLHESSSSTPLALSLLETYKKYIHHDEYFKRIKRQYEQVKSLVSDKKIMPGSGRVARSKKTGRNEVCPCGSGKKYKKCCMGN